MTEFDAANNEITREQVLNAFNHLVYVINQVNAGEWAEHYSKDGFLSAFASTEYFASRDEWVTAITDYFSARDRQQVTPEWVEITPLAPDLALLTSREKTEMRPKSGPACSSLHVFTLIWKKESVGWKIIHSHESWTNEKVS